MTGEYRAIIIIISIIIISSSIIIIIIIIKVNGLNPGVSVVCVV